jgi:hypothetical protein
MKVAGKDINEWAEIIAEQRKEFEKLTPEEQAKLRNNPVYDRWQAETDAMAED